MLSQLKYKWPVIWSTLFFFGKLKIKKMGRRGSKSFAHLFLINFHHNLVKSLCECIIHWLRKALSLFESSSWNIYFQKGPKVSSRQFDALASNGNTFLYPTSPNFDTSQNLVRVPFPFPTLYFRLNSQVPCFFWFAQNFLNFQFSFSFIDSCHAMNPHFCICSLKFSFPFFLPSLLLLLYVYACMHKMTRFSGPPTRINCKFKNTLLLIH